MKWVSVIVVNWNGGKLLRRCLDSVLDQSYHPIEIIVVDNDSSDGSADTVEVNYPEVLLIRNSRNRGFAWAQNRGIEQSKGVYVLPLNADVVLARDFVARAVEAIESRPDIGSIACMTLKYGTEEVLNVGRYLRRRISLVDSENVTEREFVFGAGGSSPLYRRDMVEDVRVAGEFFDDTYFLYWEDTDVAWRAQLLGWKCLYVPKVVAYHVGSASFGGRMRFVDKPPFIQRCTVKNRYITIMKNVSIGLFVRLCPFLLLAEVLSWAYLTLRIPGRLPYLVGGVHDFFKELPLILRKRAVIQDRRRVSDAYMIQWFRGF